MRIGAAPKQQGEDRARVLYQVILESALNLGIADKMALLRAFQSQTEWHLLPAAVRDLFRGAAEDLES